MMTPAMYGYPVTPAALADAQGNAVVVSTAASPAWLEALLRPCCTAMGCSAGFASPPLTGCCLRRGHRFCYVVVVDVGSYIIILFYFIFSIVVIIAATTTTAANYFYYSYCYFCFSVIVVNFATIIFCF